MGEVRRRREQHLYKHGAKATQEPKFEREYGKKKGDYVYGAVVGAQYRKAHGGKNWNQGGMKCSSCGSKATHKHGPNPCCGNPMCHSTVSLAEGLGGEQNTRAFAESRGRGIFSAQGMAGYKDEWF